MKTVGQRRDLARLVSDFVAQKPQYVARRQPRLQHHLATGEVVREIFHRTPPGLTTQKRCANRVAETRTRRQEVCTRVVRVGVEDEMRHAARERVITRPLQILGCFIPLEFHARERLGGATALAIDVRRTRTGIDGLEVVLPDTALRAWMPELAHRRVAPFPEAHQVAGNHVAERRLVLGRHAEFLRDDVHAGVVVRLDEIAQRPPPVEEKPLRRRRIVQHPAEDGGQLLAEVVAVGGAEIGLQRRRPRLAQTLPAVDHEPLELAAGQRAVRKTPDVGGEVGVDGGRVHLVAFPARGFLRRGAVARPVVHVADAQDRPFAGGRRPTKTPVHVLVRQVEHGVRLHPAGGILAEGRTLHEAAQHPPGETFPVVQTRPRAELHLPHVHGMLVLEDELPFAGRRLVAGERNRHGVLPNALGNFLIKNGRPLRAVNRDQPHTGFRTVGVVVVHDARGRQFQRPQGQRPVGHETAHQHAVLVRFGHGLRRPCHAVVTGGRGKGQHEQIAVVTIGIGRLPPFRLEAGNRQDETVGRRPVHVQTRIGQIAHALVLRNPWPAAHRPAGAVLHLEDKPAFRAPVGGITDEVVPIRA